MNTSAQTIFFQTFSIIHILVLINKIKKAKKILFLDNNTLVSWEYGFNTNTVINQILNKVGLEPIQIQSKKIVLWMIKIINPNVKIEILDFKDFAKIFYQLNKDSLSIVDNLSPQVMSSTAYKLMYSIVQDDNLIKYFKAFLARIIPRCSLFENLSMEFIRSESDLTIVPYNVPSKNIESSDTQKIIDSYVPNIILKVNSFIFAYKSILLEISILFLPALIFIYYSKNFLYKTKKGDFKLAIPVVWGIFPNQDQIKTHGIKRHNDDSYFYDNGFKPSEIVHIFGEWNFSSDQTLAFKKAMQEKKYAFREKHKYVISWRIIQLLLVIQWKIIVLLFRSKRLGEINYLLIYAFQKGIYHYIRKNIEIDNVNFKIEYVKSDYNPAHVINTIACHKNGRKTVGIAHAASPYDAPQIAYPHFDKYFSLCEIYEKTFGTYWENVNLVQSGRESVDWMWSRMGNKTGILQRINKLYGKRQHIVTITLPGGTVPSILSSRFREIVAGLRRLKEIDLDCHVFIRSRRINYLHESANLSPFLELPELDDRIILEHENFDTLELIAVSDLIIGASASWIINEASISGKKIFVVIMIVYVQNLASRRPSSGSPKDDA